MVYLDLFKHLEDLEGFHFNQNQNIKNSSTLSLEEAYKILNLDKNKKNTKMISIKPILKFKKKFIQIYHQKLHRLSTIVNEAKEIVLKDIS